MRYSEERLGVGHKLNDDFNVLWDQDLPSGYDADSIVDNDWIIARQVVVFSNRRLTQPERFWVEGKAMPFRLYTQNAPSSIGTRNIRCYTGITTGFNSLIEQLQARAKKLQALAGNGLLEGNLTQRIKNYVQASQSNYWSFPIKTDLKVPLVRITFDDGSSGTSQADLMCQSVLYHLQQKLANPRVPQGLPITPILEKLWKERVQREIDNFGDFWDGTEDILQGVSWALVETRNWAKGAAAVESSQAPDAAPRVNWSANPPKVEILSDGPTDNPAEVIYWYLHDICGVPSSDILNYEEARKVCDKILTIPDVAVGDAAEDKPVVETDVYKKIYPQALDSSGDIDPSRLPSVDVRRLGLDEWNNMYAGASNSEKRYQCHGAINSSMMLNSTRLLQALGEAMNGYVVSVGGKYKILPGSADTPKLTIESADITRQHIAWTVGLPLKENINAIKAEISQAKRFDFSKKSLGTIEDSELIDKHGYKEWNAGVLPFQNSEIVGRRRMTDTLRKTSPYLLRGTLTVGRGDNWKFWDLIAGDRIILNHPVDGIENTTFRIESMQPLHDSQITLIIKEDPDELYSDKFSLLGEGFVDSKSDNSEKVERETEVTVTSHEVKWDELEPSEFAFPLVGLSKVISLTNIYALEGTLVVKINDGDYQEVTTDLSIANRITSVSLNSDGPGYNIIFVLPKSDQRSVFITFAVRNGEDTEENPYTYDAETLLPISNDLRIEDLSERVTAEPTGDDGKPIGTFYCQPA